MNKTKLKTTHGAQPVHRTLLCAGPGGVLYVSKLHEDKGRANSHRGAPWPWAGAADFWGRARIPAVTAAGQAPSRRHRAGSRPVIAAGAGRGVAAAPLPGQKRKTQPAESSLWRGKNGPPVAALSPRRPGAYSDGDVERQKLAMLLFLRRGSPPLLGCSR
eukprot:CAMPEP_0206253374 /NCGR_PEP_ID=MMETSP0047_2-20121206/23117_1 /ASSEMBLY_ACC=CAM_ASM_000192 /TAXON_ID=195065 /ORGANISM="Chroomonas mesostigmatica_cf, Strain CCMP1168" /LENGTH=159 /DNA_ID=CAMNT_0053679577 /DNA_START=434 /DNA_END=913 /DNA_ORIENTATION=+